MFGMCTVLLTWLDGKQPHVLPQVKTQAVSVGDVLKCKTADGAVVRARVSHVTHNAPTIQTAASLGSWEVYAEEIT
jgi:hypothetical protein